MFLIYLFSKSAAAAVATWLSHDIIGLHQKGYGLLLGQATFSSIKVTIIL